MTLPTASLPAGPFTISLRPMQKPIDDTELSGHIVRYDQNGTASFGIDFKNLNPETEKKIRRFVVV